MIKLNVIQLIPYFWFCKDKTQHKRIVVITFSISYRYLKIEQQVLDTVHDTGIQKERFVGYTCDMIKSVL